MRANRATHQALEKTAQKLQTRIALLDELRGLAVLCMMFFHLFFMMASVFKMQTGRWLYEFFSPAQPLFAGLFIVISGLCSRFSHSNAKRGLRLLAAALVISLFTIWFLPLLQVDSLQIRFGILHFLSVCMLLFACSRPLLDKINPVAGVCICLVLYLVTSSVENGYLGIGKLVLLRLPAVLYQSNRFFPLGFHKRSFASADYFPLLPHMFLFFAGSFFGKFPVARQAYHPHIPPLGFLGRHSFFVYLLHIPAAVALAYLLSPFLK